MYRAYIFLVFAYAIASVLIEKDIQLFLMPAILGILSVHTLSGGIILISLAVSFAPFISYIFLSLLSYHALLKLEALDILTFVLQGFLASFFFQIWYAIVDLSKSIYARFFGNS